MLQDRKRGKCRRQQWRKTHCTARTGDTLQQPTKRQQNQKAEWPKIVAVVTAVVTKKKPPKTFLFSSADANCKCQAVRKNNSKVGKEKKKTGQNSAAAAAAAAANGSALMQSTLAAAACLNIETTATDWLLNQSMCQCAKWILSVAEKEGESEGG